jgi:hypothetical protein
MSVYLCQCKCLLFIHMGYAAVTVTEHISPSHKKHLAVLTIHGHGYSRNKYTSLPSIDIVHSLV